MSDSTKAQKLAAARKKLKEFQQKSKNVKKQNVTKQEHGASELSESEKVDSLTSSTCSSLNSPVVTEDPQTVAVEECSNGKTHFDNQFQATNLESINITYNVEEPGDDKNNLPIYNYFSNTGYDSAYNDRNNFFDNISETASKTDDTDLAQKLSNISSDSGRNLYNTAVYLDNNLYSTPALFAQSHESTHTIEDSEFKLNQIYDNLNKNNITEEDAMEINKYLTSEKNEYFNDRDDEQDRCMLNEISSWNKGGEKDVTESEVKPVEIEIPQSNVESLLQLSSQIAELIEPNSEYSLQPTVTQEPDKRNQELAALLQQEQIKSEQLKRQLDINMNRNAELEKELEQIREDHETSLVAEIGPLQEQLQQHIHDVGVLVGERTELSAMLKQSQATVKEKINECEELRARLKTSRSRVADLEKEMGNLKLDHEKLDKLENYDQIKNEYDRIRELNDELSQDILELREKLTFSTNENLQMQQEIQHLSSKLGLAEIRIQQLTSGRDGQVDAQIEMVTQQKFALEKQLTEVNNSLKATVKERDQANAQFQQHVQHLNAQLSNFANQLETASKENENLRLREQNLVAHIGELEKHLQNLQNEHINIANLKNNGELKRELEKVQEASRILEIEKIQMQENFTRVSNERDMLLKDIDAKKDSILELESLIERLQGNQPDTSKLLAEIESDKVAAARAVSQNVELKNKLQEMQDDFVKMSNDKLMLAEQLNSEQVVNKEIKEKLQQTEVHLQTLSEAIEIKDRELTHLRQDYEELNRQVLQQGQLTDRLRHYEAQGNSSQSIQAELQQAQQFIENLSEENYKLKEEMKTWKMLQLAKIENSEVGIRNQNNGTNLEPDQLVNDLISDNSNNNLLNKEAAMRQLEEKFLKTMQDIANLTEEKQRLEHIVLQLQGETETIGEYIALYQHQRGLLKQKALEKDEQLKQLANDREIMKTKLDQLNALIKKLVLEKGGLSKEILEEHESLNMQSRDLCEEHAKIHHEISKSVESSVSIDNGNESEIAEKIIALLSEIKSSNLVQPSENFHPCPWCSGKLITV